MLLWSGGQVVRRLRLIAKRLSRNSNVHINVVHVTSHSWTIFKVKFAGVYRVHWNDEAEP